jgi:HPt (histidine-containing phosphotransfer) domain-containing protein
MSGINDCVGKPFTSQELWRCLMKYLKPLNRQVVNKVSQTHTDDELRHKLTADFVKDNRNKFSEITEALSAGDIKLAHRLVHTLKSNAAYFGKTLLQQTAADIELQLKDGQNLVTAQQLAALETELKAVLTEFAAKAETNFISQVTEDSRSGAAVQSEPVNTEFVRKKNKKLEPMLEMGNLDCRELIDSLRLIPGTDKLRQQIKNLDLEEALVTLVELKKKLRIL